MTVCGEWDSLVVCEEWDSLVVCEEWDSLVVCPEWDSLEVSDKDSVWSADIRVFRYNHFSKKYFAQPFF